MINTFISRTTTLVGVICLWLALANSAFAATYYIATTGNDANPGTQAAPFRTIAKGIAVAAANGDTLSVAAGTYVERVYVSEKSLFLKGAGAGQCIINGSAGGSCITLDNVPAGSRVEGFTFTNGGEYYGAGMYNFGSSPTVAQCIFRGNTGAAGGGMSNLQGSSPVLKNCLFYSNTADYGAAMFNSSGSSPTLIQCTLVKNLSEIGEGGIRNEASCYPAVRNCILWGNSGSGITDVNSNTTASYSNIQGGYDGTGNINADPLFANAQTDDYHLRSGSPCIDTGSAAVPNLPTTDLDGRQRILGSAPDMGVYEIFPANFSWYVDKQTGNDANSGTSAQPFATVARALALAVNGNSIYIKQGNYGTDKPRITKSLRLFNWTNTGFSRIGKP